MKNVFIILILSSLFLGSCDHKLENTNTVIADFDLSEYNYFTSEANNLPFTPNGSLGLRDERAALGRLLFYDTRLSLNESISCGTCHQQKLAFAEDEKVSLGLFKDKLNRNSPSLTYAYFRGQYFWDARVHDIKEAVMTPIFTHSEMEMPNVELLIERLETTDHYPQLFQNVYGSKGINESTISQSIANFMSSLYSFDSKFDKGVLLNFGNFNFSESNGMEIFHSASCSNCHQGATFDSYYRESNIGLDLVYEDQGTKDGRFKVPSLRNVELTAPYMHDGRFETLEEVIDHYDHGVKAHVHLDWSLKSVDGSPKRLNLSDSDKEDLKAFLLTLTDRNILRDVKYSNPYR